MSKFLTEHPWLFALILIAVVNLPAATLLGYAVNRQNQVVDCISHWADETSTRTQVLSNASDTRSEELDELIRSVGTQDPAIFQDRYNKYIIASDSYKTVRDQNPVPESPRLVC